MTVQLRPYQSRAVAETLAYLQRGCRGVAVESPVGSGKTTMGMSVVKTLLDAGKRGAWLAHRVELCDQASERAALYGIPHGRVMPGHEIGPERFHICSVDTLAARLGGICDWLESLDFIFIDEAQHIVASGWNGVVSAAVRAQRVGLSATWFRLDGRGLGEGNHFDRIVQCPGSRDLTAMGYLAPAIVYSPPTDLDMRSVPKLGGDYKLSDMAAEVQRAQLAVIGRRWYARHAPGQPALVFCPTVEMAEASAAAYRAAGWSAQSVDGTMSARERAAAVKGLASGRIQILTSVSLLGEGFDCPEIAVAILERPTESTSLFIQQIGRALRPHPDKSHAVILDLVMNTARHGMYDAPRPWTLEGGLKGLERQVAPTSRCVRCWRVHEKADHCPGCGCGYPKAKKGALDTVWHLPSIAGRRPEVVAAMTLQDAVEIATSRRDMEAIAELKGINDRGWVDRAMQRTGIAGRQAAE